VLFELLRAQARVRAAIQGLGAGSAERPVARGKWTVRETVLHLHAWDLEWERALEGALRGALPDWFTMQGRALAAYNERLLAPLRAVPWDEAVRLLHAGRARLLEEVEGLPEEPPGMWTRQHPLGQLLALLAEHDHHHAAVLKRAREGFPRLGA
jgi:uncharacterized damage-inducible protein DinB